MVASRELKPKQLPIEVWLEQLEKINELQLEIKMLKADLIMQAQIAILQEKRILDLEAKLRKAHNRYRTVK